eukprot:2085894-Pyramimonas_sp.AAC.1
MSRRWRSATAVQRPNSRHRLEPTLAAQPQDFFGASYSSFHPGSSDAILGCPKVHSSNYNGTPLAS